MLTVKDIKLIDKLLSEVIHEAQELPYDEIPWAEEEEDPIEKEVLRRFNKAKKNDKN